MINEYKRSYGITGPHVNTLEVTVYYNKGGMNYFYGKPEQRGYYLSMSPCYISERNGIVTKETSMFGRLGGVKWCILPCERQSKKRFETAESMVDEMVGKYMLDFLKERDLKLVDGTYTERHDERRV